MNHVHFVSGLQLRELNDLEWAFVAARVGTLQWKVGIRVEWTVPLLCTILTLLCVAASGPQVYLGLSSSGTILPS